MGSALSLEGDRLQTEKNKKKASPVLCNAFFLICVLTFLNCTDSLDEESDGKGHFEDFTEEQLEQFANQQTVVPEHSGQTEQVILGISLLDPWEHADIAAEILEAGAGIIFVVPNGFQRGLENPVFNTLKNLVDPALMSRVTIVYSSSTDGGAVWARDWSPLIARSNTNPETPVVLDMNYYSYRPASDASARDLMTAMVDSQSNRIERISLPVYNEGGNFMSTYNSSGNLDCFMAERVLEANEEIEVPGDRILDREQIAYYYERFAGCENVYIYPRMPHEGTGHIDMWSKFLQDKTVIVNSIERSEIDAMVQLLDQVDAPFAKREMQRKFEQIAVFLRERKEAYERLGYNVVTIPLPVPLEESEGNGLVFKSYTNSLLVNDTAIIPRYSMPFPEWLRNERAKQRYREFQDQRIARYEEAVSSAYQQLGFAPVFVLTEDLISFGGAVHCVTMESALPLLYASKETSPEGDGFNDVCHTVPLNDSDYCSSSCRCGQGEGDCDRDNECQQGLVCNHDVGADYGLRADLDVCEREEGPDSSCHTVPLNDSDYCSFSCPCGEGEGDCDRDSHCESGLWCFHDVGAEYGHRPDLDLCLPPDWN
jgi:agmatine/peptidylarginine deiminase